MDIELLILSIEKHPSIWDPSAEAYSNRNVKDEAWLHVGKEVFANWDQCSEKDKSSKIMDMKKKWTNVRDYYRKDRQLVKKTKSGQSASKKKRYVYADMLSFLEPTLERRTTESNYEEDVAEADGDGKSETADQTEEIFQPEEAPSTHNISRPDKRSSKKSTSTVQSEILNILKSRSQSKETAPDAHFLLSFLPDLNQMSDAQKLEFKIGMTQLVQKIRFPPQPIQPAHPQQNMYPPYQYSQPYSSHSQSSYLPSTNNFPCTSSTSSDFNQEYQQL